MNKPNINRPKVYESNYNGVYVKIKECGLSENQNDLFSPTHKKYKCKLETQRGVVSFDFQRNPDYLMHDVTEFMECLLNDYFDYIECDGELGYLIDDLGYSYKEAKRIYKELEREYKKLNKVFTKDEINSIYNVINGNEF